MPMGILGNNGKNEDSVVTIETDDIDIDIVISLCYNETDS